MQHSYLFRMRSGLALRLGLSGVLLLSSAGLAVAASLLLYVAANSVPTYPTWQPFSPSQTTELTISTSAASTEPATQLAGIMPFAQPNFILATYLPASSSAGNLATTLPTIGESSPPPALTSTVKATMQRSWTTIKLAFR